MFNQTWVLPIGSIFFLLVAAPDLVGQAASQEKLIELRKKKLASAFLQKAAWQTDFDKAQALAKKTRQHIFVYFTRSFAP